MLKSIKKKSAVKGQWRGDTDNINRAGGPPKTHWWSTLLEEKAKDEDKMRKMANKEVMAEALIEKCKTGDIAALKEFGDRVQGKPFQTADVTTGGEKLSGVTVTLVDACED